MRWFSILSAVCVVAAAQATQPWEEWAQDPLFATASFETRITAPSNHTFTVTLADTVLTAFGGEGTPVTNNAFAELKYYHPYRLTVTGTNLSYVQADFMVGGGLKLLDPKDPRKNVPTGVKLLIDDLEETWLSGGGSDSNSWKIEVRRDVRPRWRVDDDSNDPNTAPGDGEWARIGPGRSLNTNRCAIDWSVSLGHLLDNNAAGKLRLQEPGLFAGAYTPSNLFYTCKGTNVHSQVELVVTNLVAGVLRQVKAPETFVDIVPGTNQYSLKFYHPANVGSETNASGLYTNITGQPFVTWQIVNPDNNPALSNKLDIIEERQGRSRTNRIEFDAGTRTWTLRQGDSPEQRVETRQITFSVNGSRTNRAETVEIKYAGGASAYKAVEEYELFPWGWELYRTTVDPDGSALLTEFEYYSQVTDPDYEYQRLKWIKFPDGRWEKRRYDGDYPGLLDAVWRPWSDYPENPEDATEEESLRTEYTYNLNFRVPSENRQKLYNEEDDYLFTVRHENFSEAPHGANMLGRDQALSADEGGVYEVGTTERFFPPDAPIGLADHIILEYRSGQPARFHYHDHGTYDSTNHAFSYVATNHTYTSNPSLPVGPDRRETVFYCSKDGLMAGSIQLLTVEDHFYDIGNNPPLYLYFYPYQSWKETTVISKGVPVLKEKYVCSGTNGLGEPVFELLQKLVLQNDTLGHVTNIVRIDPVSASSRAIYSADYRGTNSVDGDLKFSETNEFGTKTVFTYDSLKRPKTITKIGISDGGAYPAQSDIVTSNDYDAQHRQLRRITSSGGLSTTNSVTYDLAGRVLTRTDAAGLVTSLSYSEGGRITTTTHPGGATEIVENYRDGRPKSKTGTSVVAEHYDYQADWWADLEPRIPWVQKFTKVSLVSTNSPRWHRIGTDWVDNTVYFEAPAFSVTNLFTNVLYYVDGVRLSKTTTNDMPRGVFAYDSMGRLWRQALHEWNPAETSYGTPVPVVASLDRIQQTDIYFRKIGNVWYEATTNLTYLTDNSATPTVLGVTLEQLTDLSSTEVSRTFFYDHFTNLTISTVVVDRANKRVTETMDPPQSSLSAVRVTVNGLLQTERTPTVAADTWHTYDALGREIANTNPQGASSTTTYHAATGQVIATTDFTGQPTWFEYYPGTHTNAGRLKTLTAANGKRTFYEYTPRGKLWRTWGEVPYPEERIYSDYGELIELRTHRTGSDWANTTWPGGSETPDKTFWKYQAETGLLTNKLDNVNKGAKFTYYDNGLLRTRQWHRGTTMTNVYNKFADLIRIGYSDNTAQVRYTNDTFQTYSRAGLPRYIVDATGEREMYYDALNRVTGERWVSGFYANLTVTNHYDTLYGRDWVKVQKNGADQFTHSYTYDSQGRLATVAEGVYTAAYGYLANSDLVQSATFKNNGSTKLTTTRIWEKGVRLHSIANVTTFTPSSHTYAYDGMNRRIGATLADGSRWAYDYNDRNELVSGRRFWADQTPVSGQQFEYAFDSIGNLKTNRSGGDVNGLNLRSSAYTANSLNQYTAVGVPGYEDVIGVAHAGATVTVNGQSTDRKGEYYRCELSITNGSGPVWQSITATSTTNVTGKVLVPPASQTLTYDDDGNLTSDGLWTYVWDAENRLIQMTPLAAIPDAEVRRLNFAYDHMGRRIWKRVDYKVSGSWTTFYERKFIYDGWNLIAELWINDGIVKKYLWGLDLSGSEQGAGGVGGLLKMWDYYTSKHYFAGYDGNGNVTVLVDAATQALGAQYEYSPFGETLRATGPVAKSNPFRFSTKFTDQESDLVYYGYRYYSPSLMRWVNRDPIEEEGGVNLLALVMNNPVNGFDPFGQSILSLLPDPGEQSAKASQAKTGASLIGRIQEAVDMYSDISELTSVIMDAATGDSTDLLIQMFESANQGLSGGMVKKARTAGFDDHHVFSRAFRTKFKQAGIDPDRITIGLERFAHRKLHTGKGARGGKWNAAWKGFFEHYKEQGVKKIDPKDIFEYGAKMIHYFGLL